MNIAMEQGIQKICKKKIYNASEMLSKYRVNFGIIACTIMKLYNGFIKQLGKNGYTADTQVE